MWCKSKHGGTQLLTRWICVYALEGRLLVDLRSIVMRLQELLGVAILCALLLAIVWIAFEYVPH